MSILPCEPNCEDDRDDRDRVKGGVSVIEVAAIWPVEVLRLRAAGSGLRKTGRDCPTKFISQTRQNIERAGATYSC